METGTAFTVFIGIQIRNISTSATDPDHLEMNSTENVIQKFACYQQTNLLIVGFRN